jgi:8-oxo-dGTP pyrophosphatase MutT (NUDIX family)
VYVEHGVMVGEPQLVPPAHAAVALIEVVGSEPSILLMRRSNRPGDAWAGHWAFPGGRMHRDDPSLFATCLRETQEEVGVHLTRSAWVADLPLAVAGRHNGQAIPVAPFHFRLADKPELCLDPNEVESIHWCPLAVVCDRAAHQERVVRAGAHELRRPCVLVEGVPLWGFTYQVLLDWLVASGQAPS